MRGYARIMHVNNRYFLKANVVKRKVHYFWKAVAKAKKNGEIQCVLSSVYRVFRAALYFASFKQVPIFSHRRLRGPILNLVWFLFIDIQATCDVAKSIFSYPLFFLNSVSSMVILYRENYFSCFLLTSRSVSTIEHVLQITCGI